jgi:serine/threonine-protein kinase HipA
MKTPVIKYCPGTLRPGFDTYSPAFLRKMFNGKKVSHILPFASPNDEGPLQEKFIENRERLSISGVQIKLSVILDKNNLRLTEDGEQGQYILKPIPADLLKRTQVPANEHLTMQIAEQVYNISTAVNGMIFFNDGKPAYITRRFDVKPDGTKYRQEDFASLLGKTEETAGQGYKYDSDYLLAGRLLQKNVSASVVEQEKYYNLVVFNYLFSNGDAHLKNFSLIESVFGDYVLSPAYDLVCSRVHVNDHDVALHDGLYEGDIDDASFKNYGSYCYDQFYELGHRLGIKDERVKRILKLFCADQPKVQTLIGHSFLDKETKEKYTELYHEKLKKLNTSVTNMEKVSRNISKRNSDELDESISQIERDLNRINPNDKVEVYFSEKQFFKMFDTSISELMQAIIPTAQKFNRLFKEIGHGVYVINSIGKKRYTNESVGEIIKDLREDCVKNKNSLRSGKAEFNFSFSYRKLKNEGTISAHSEVMVYIEDIDYRVEMNEFVDGHVNNKVIQIRNRKLDVPLAKREINDIGKKLGKSIVNQIDFYTKKKGIR